MKKTATRKTTKAPAQALTSAPAAVRKRVGGAARTDAPEVVNEAELLSDLRNLIQSAQQRIASVAYSTQTLLCWHLGVGSRARLSRVAGPRTESRFS